MVIWKYIIKGKIGTYITQDYRFAEEKSKHGFQVFCKRENTISKYT